MSITSLSLFISGHLCADTLTHPLRVPKAQGDSFVSNGGVDKQSVGSENTDGNTRKRARVRRAREREKDNN